MRKAILTVALTGLFLPAAAHAQAICAQAPSTSVGVGSAVGGTVGQILGVIGDAMISGGPGSTTCVPWNQRQRADAYGYYEALLHNSR